MTRAVVLGLSILRQELSQHPPTSANAQIELHMTSNAGSKRVQGLSTRLL
jgi:hypothetical protein